MAEPGRSPLPGGLFRNLVLSVAVLFCMLGAVELFARVFIPQWAPSNSERIDFWRRDTLLGWTNSPGAEGRFDAPGFSTSVRISAQGLRDDEYPVQRAAGRKRMLVLGDSFGWGFGVEHDEIFCELLERRNPAWEIINASVSGYSTDQELLYYEYPGARWSPDVVLVLFFVNDLFGNNAASLYSYPKPFYRAQGDSLVLENVPVPSAAIYVPLFRWLGGRTYAMGRLVAALAQAYHWLLAPRASEAFVDAEHGYCAGGDLDGKFSSTGREFLRLRALTLARHARLVVVSVQMHPACSRAVEEFFHREDIMYLSLDSAFAGKEHVTHRDGFHWNAAGHAIAAKAVEEFLAKEKVW